VNENYDLIVIGTGGAAMAAGIAARERGNTVLLVESNVLGGTCLNVGCVPSKRLLAASGHRHTAATNPFPAAPTSAGGVDLPALIAQKQQLVNALRDAKYQAVADALGFPIRHGHACFTDEHTLDVDGEQLTSPAFIVATGSQPATPDMPGIDGVDFLTSTSAMEQTQLPTSMIVVGAGYVGLEQSQLWSQLGVTVTVVGRFAPHTEPELATLLKDAFTADGITVVEQRVTAVATTKGGVAVTTDGGQALSAERLLLATGRRPNTDGLRLDAAGVKTDERGFLVVDDHQRTSNERIWAAGDVSGAPQYVYVAARTGHVAAANALGDPQTVDYRGLPGVTFTTPQLASAGLTERQARDQGHGCDCRTLSADDLPRALANNDTRGALKIVIDADTRKVLGVHAALDGAGDVILAATYAIKYGLTVEDVAETWAPYLTMAEALRLCARLFRSDLPTSCCA